MLAACASQPKGGGAVIAFPAELYLCSGVAISNAPATDDYRKVIAYAPHARVRGVSLALAPVDGACVSSAYGPRRGGAGLHHDGLDLYTGRPRAVAAGGDGQIVFAGTQRGYGRVIEIGHGNGVSTRYAHLSAFAPGLRRGDRVRAGEIIARTGDSGNATAVHLHYEIIIDGRPQNPLTVGG